jgi:hypothetical protein
MSLLCVSLEQDMARMGISKADLDLPAQQLAESTRALARVESAQILSRKFLQRDRVKQKIVENHHRFLDKVRVGFGRLSTVYHRQINIKGMWLGS